MRRTVSLSTLVVEGVGNLYHGRWLAWLLILAAFAGAMWATIGEAASTGSILEDEQQFRAKGGYVFILESRSLESNPTLLARRDCERLEHADTVEAAGSIGELPATSLARSPRAQTRMVGASPGVAGVLASLDQKTPYQLDRILVSPTTATDLGLTDGSLLSPAGSKTSSVAVAPLSVLGAGYGQALMEFVPPVGRAPLCFVALHPDAAHQAETLPAVFARTDVAVERLLRGADLIEPAAQRSAERPTRHAWWITAVAYGVFSLTVLWIKRSDIALYKGLGVNTIDIRVITAAETVTASLIGGLGGVTLGGAIAAWSWEYAAMAPAWWSGIATVAAMATASTLAALVSYHPTPMHGLKDR